MKAGLPTKRIAVWLIVGSLMALFILALPFIDGIALGVIFAVAVDPLNRYLLKSGWTKFAAAITVTILFHIFIFLPLGYFGARGLTYSVESLRNHLKDLPLSSQGIREKLRESNVGESLVDGSMAWLDLLGVDEGGLQDLLSSAVGVVGAKSINRLETVLKEVPMVSLGFLFFSLTLFFALFYKDNLLSLYKRTTVEVGDLAILAKSAVKSSSHATIVANFVGGLVQALIFALGAYLANIENLSLIVFLGFGMSFVPIFGTSPLTLSFIFERLVNGNLQETLIWGAAGILAGVSDNLVKPLVLQQRVRLNPFVGLISVLGGMVLFGMPGVFLGPFIANMAVVMLPHALDSIELIRD